jgi:hypothetical protein
MTRAALVAINIKFLNSITPLQLGNNGDSSYRGKRIRLMNRRICTILSVHQRRQVRCVLYVEWSGRSMSRTVISICNLVWYIPGTLDVATYVSLLSNVQRLDLGSNLLTKRSGSHSALATLYRCDRWIPANESTKALRSESPTTRIWWLSGRLWWTVILAFFSENIQILAMLNKIVRRSMGV